METTNAKGSLGKVTLAPLVAQGNLTKIVTHVYVEQNGQMVCTGCKKNIINTSYGEHVRASGQTLRANEKECSND